MGLTFSDNELLVITQILSQTTWKPNQAEVCLKVSAILRKIGMHIKSKDKKGEKDEK